MPQAKKNKLLPINWIKLNPAKTILIISLISYDWLLNNIGRLLGVTRSNLIGIDGSLQILISVVLIVLVIRSEINKTKKLWLSAIWTLLSSVLLLWLYQVTPIIIYYHGVGDALLANTIKLIAICLAGKLRDRLDLFFATFGYIIISLAFLFLELWDQFAVIVLTIITKVSYILGLQIITNNQTNLITLNNFSVTLGAPCSGLSSFLTFTALYFILLYEQMEVNRGKFYLWYILGTAIVYSINIIRIISLMYVGSFYSAEFAIKSFHAYSGAIFFFTFTIGYITWLLKKYKLNH